MKEELMKKDLQGLEVKETLLFLEEIQLRI